MVVIDKEVNPRFEDFLFDWRQKFQFLVGGYGSSKSYHVALKIVLKCLSEKRKVLVIREVFETHKDSTFSLFKDILDDLELLDESGRRKITKGKARAKESPYEIVFANGSKIIFKGMDKPAKLKSIHDISIIWLEECSEVKYEGFKELIGRLRHRTLSLHMILSTNPIGEDNWTFKHFFKDELNDYFVLDDEELYEKGTIVLNNTYYHHSTADDNLFLPQEYIEELDGIKLYDLDLYRIARLGRFGVNGVRVLPQFMVEPHEVVEEAIRAIQKPLFKNGMDFGFVTSYNAVIRMAIDHDEKILYIYEEYYKKGLTDVELAEDLQHLRKIVIKADSAEPKTIAYFRQQRFKMLPAKKFAGSRAQYTKKVKRFKKIICSTNCPNAIRELKTLTFKQDQHGHIIEDEFNIDPHTLSAIWYGLDDYEVSSLKGHNAHGYTKTG